MLIGVQALMLQVVGGAAAAIVLVTLWHELGHLAVLWLLGVPVKKVCLGLGPTLWERRYGVLTLALRAIPAGMSIAVPARREDDGLERRPIWHDMLVAAAGPLASFLLAGVLLFVGRALSPGGVFSLALMATAALSAVLAVLNLLPFPGLDGGHLALLCLALAGWEMAPSVEQKLHRVGLHAVSALALTPLLFHLFRLLDL